VSAMEKLLSIIVPTYNMEKLLQKCLSSLIVSDQTLFSLLDILVINDGSKDKSSEIAHSFESKYSGVYRVVDKPNGNYGSCINVALPMTKGKYVKILDADDYFETTGFEEYLKKMVSIDVDLVLNDKITVNQEYVKTSEQIIPIDSDVTLPFEEISKYWAAIDMHKMAYRRELLLSMGYKQTEGISYSDAEWMIKPFANVRSAYSTGINVYCYLQGREGQTIDKSVRRKSFKSLHKMIVSVADYWKNYNGDENRKCFLRDYLAYSVINIYREFFFETKFDDFEFREFDSEMVSNYGEIIADTDTHKWVSFFPNLKLAEDWRRRRRLKFAVEYSIITGYLNISGLARKKTSHSQ